MRSTQTTLTDGGEAVNWDQNAWFQLLVAFIAHRNDVGFDRHRVVILFCKLLRRPFPADSVVPSIETADRSAQQLLSVLAQSNLDISPASMNKQGQARSTDGSIFDLGDDWTEVNPGSTLFNQTSSRKRRSESQPLASPSAVKSKCKKAKPCLSMVSDADSDADAVSHGYVRNLWNPPTRVQRFVEVAIPMADIDKSQYESAPSSPAPKMTTPGPSTRPLDGMTSLENGTPHDNGSPRPKLACPFSSSASSTSATSSSGFPNSSGASRWSELNRGRASQGSQTSQSTAGTGATPSSQLQETASTAYRSAFAAYNYHDIDHPLVNMRCTSNNSHLIHTPRFSFPDVPVARMPPETNSAADALDTEGLAIDDEATTQAQIDRDRLLAQQLQSALGVPVHAAFRSLSAQSSSDESSDVDTLRARAMNGAGADEDSTFGSEFDLADPEPASSSQPPQSAGESRDDRLSRLKTEKKARRKGKQKAQVAETEEGGAAETTPVPQKKTKDKQKKAAKAAKKAKKAAEQARKAAEEAEAEQDA